MDECLPHQIADFLQSLGYPIISWYQEFNQQQGAKDPWLIPYLGGKQYTWITKDDEAKKEHESSIRTAGISVIWIRGLERIKGRAKRNKISVRDVHRMLTDKLGIIENEISHSNKPLYYVLSVKTGATELIPVHRKITLEAFFKESNKRSNTV